MNEERKESTREVSTAERTEKEGSNMSGDRAGRRRAGRPGRRPAKVDVKVKLEKSRQSARECRARKKLRYQYLEDLVNSRENAIYSLREELEMYKQWCIQLDNGHIPLGLLNKFQQEDEMQSMGATGTVSDMEDKSNSPSSQGSTVSVEIEDEKPEPQPRYQSPTQRSSILKSEREGKSVENRRDQFNLSFVNRQNLNTNNDTPVSEQNFQTSCAPVLSTETSFPRSNSGSDTLTNVVNKVSTQNTRRVGQVLNTPLSLRRINLLTATSEIDVPKIAGNSAEKWSSMEFRSRKSTGSFENDCLATEGSSESNDEMPMTQRKDSVDFKVGSDFRTMNIMSGSQSGNNPNNPFTTSTGSSFLSNNPIVQTFGNTESVTRDQQTFVQSYPLQSHQTSFLMPASTNVATTPFDNARTASQIGDIVQGLLTPSLTNISTSLTPVCSSQNFQVVPDEMHEFFEGFAQDIPSCTSNLTTGSISHTFANVVPNSTVASMSSLEQNLNIVPSRGSTMPESNSALNSHLVAVSTAASSNECSVPSVGTIPTIIDDLD